MGRDCDFWIVLSVYFAVIALVVVLEIGWVIILEREKQAEKKAQELEEDHDFIMLCAFRYALPRRSYAPSVVCKYIERHSSELSVKFMETVIKELNEFDEGTDLIDIDHRQLWLHLRDDLEAELDCREAYEEAGL